MFDWCVQHDGFHNTYSFTKDGYKVVLKPMHPEEFSKKPKRVELMMRSGVVGYRGQGRPVLFAKGLDSRTSLSQPGANNVNPRAQAQVPSLFKWRFSHLWTCFKRQDHKGSCRTELEAFQGRLPKT